MSMWKTLILWIGLLLPQFSFAQLQVARLFTDHAILQRQKPIVVWGWAAPQDLIRVELAGKHQTTTTNAAGKWQVSLPAMEAGGPHEMGISNGKESLRVQDILIGDVWLCSGQSNMEWTVKQADHFKIERQNAQFPQIRQFYVAHEVALSPQEKLNSGEWKASNVETVGDFTAAGFFFAREVHQKTGIPIGLLHASWGGSQVESWMSKEGMATHPEFKGYAQNLPMNWRDADAFHDRKLRMQLLGADRKPNQEDEKAYTRAGFDISKWHHGGSPLGQWDWKGIWAFRGKGYMARQLVLSGAFTDGFTSLGLGIQDNYNEVYVNGRLVFAGILKGIRQIQVPPQTWQAGANTLMIKFDPMREPNWYGLGVLGQPEDLYLSSATEKISLADDWKLMPSFAEAYEYVHSSNNIGTSIYNAMIAPLIPFSIRGALWYQGESNAGRAHQYRESFPLMIRDWREKWQDTFPFYFVQLTSYGANQSSNEGSTWAELREAQTQTLALPQTGMAVTIDVGNPADIHPTDKQTIGHRLARLALHKVYGQNIAAESPRFASLKVHGGKATLTFQQVGSGLMVKDKFGYLKGFEVAGEDRIFYYAKAELSNDQVLVYHPKNQKIAAIRYAWADAPIEANLFSKDGLPVTPFRTDTWAGLTFGKKFE